MMTTTGLSVRLSLAVALLTATAPAIAQQRAQPGPALGFPLELALPPPTDTGKARFFRPPLDRAPAGCAALLDCRLRLLGAVQRNGAVELNAALFRW